MVQGRHPGGEAAPSVATERARWRRALPLALLIMVIAMRAGILVTGQRYLRSDEAVVGLMARHIVTRGERPLFLYGQPYGGGHALVAYVAAPLFAVFGSSAILLTAISAFVSVISVLLLWLILRRGAGEGVAAAGAAIYAFSPPVAYQAFMVNGGAESFCLALLALLFFLKVYHGAPATGRGRTLFAGLAGLFVGLAYYAMDYALLYVIVFVLLLTLTGPRGKWASLGALLAGFLAGCAPLIVYNLSPATPFAHVRHMFGGAAGPRVGLIEHVFGALWGVVSGDLAAFFLGDIDNFKRAEAGPGSWLHAALAVAATAALLIRQRSRLAASLRRLSLRGRDEAPLPFALLPAVFIVAYLAMYCVARFSLPLYRTPRYFLPLCPFVSIAIALVLLGLRGRRMKRIGAIVAFVLVARGAFVATEFGARPWHEEHRIKTSGADIAALARWLEQQGIRAAVAPYEIQARLMFESDERVVVACRPLSLMPRYAWFEEEAARRIAAGEPWALVLRTDMAFALASLPPERARAIRARLESGRPAPLLRMTFDPIRLKGKARVVADRYLVFAPLDRAAFADMTTPPR